MKRVADAKTPPIVQAFDTLFRYLRWLALLMAVLYLATGITSVQPGEQAIVLTFGKESKVEDSGLLLAWPYPIDEVVRVATGESRRLEVKELWKLLPGLEQADQSADPLSPEITYSQELVPETIDPLREGYCITGDKDILQAYVAVKYRIDDPVDYALRQTDPEALLTDVTMTALTHVLGGVTVDVALNQRDLIARAIARFIINRLAGAESGIKVESVELVQLHPPRHVIKEFREVVKAEIEVSQKVAKAKADAQRLIKRAEATTSITVAAAEADAKNLREQARGQAEAFSDLLDEYRKNPAVVGPRLYREAIGDIQSAGGRIRVIKAVPGGVTTIVIQDEDPFAEEPYE